MFRTYIIVVQVPRFFDGIFDNLFGPGGLGQFAHGDHVRAALDELLDLEANLAEVYVQILKDVRPDAAAFLDEAEQDMFCADVFVVEALGLLIGQRHDLPCPVRKAFKHVHLLDGRQG